MSANNPFPDTRNHTPDYSIVENVHDIDRTRQVALRVTVGSSANAGSGTTVNIDSRVNTTIFALPRVQTASQLAFVGNALKAGGGGDLVDLIIASGEGASSNAAAQNATIRGVRLCIEFLGIHASLQYPFLPKPLKYHLRDYLQGDDRDFVFGNLILNEGTENQENGSLFECFLGAKALGYRPLVELCAAAVAQTLAGKTVVQMRTILGVESDYTDEEEKELSAANKKMFPEEAHRF